MEEKNQGGGSKKIYIAIIILLLLINIVSVYFLWSENKKNDDQLAANTELQQQAKAKVAEMDSLNSVLESYKGQNSEQDSIINEKQAQLEEQTAKIKQLLSSNSLTKNKYNQALKEIEQYKASISELQKQVSDLQAQNQELNTQKNQLTNDLNAERQTTASLNQDLAIKNKKVELGSLLHLTNITVEGIKKKGNGKETVVNKAKTVESLKISFETGDNKVLEPGNMSLYIRIISPKGETISVADQGSGTIKSADNNQDVQFTKKADFDWSQSNKKIVVYWSQNVQTSGTYKVEIYQSGYMVGQGQVALK